jgi:hypothetical protein
MNNDQLASPQTEKKSAGLYRIFLRTALIATSIVYVFFAIWYLFTGDEPFTFAFYIPIYTLIFVHLPAVALVIMTYVLSIIRNKQAPSGFGREMVLSVISVSCFILMLLAIFLLYSPT